jgi:hypothetical protein
MREPAILSLLQKHHVRQLYRTPPRYTALPEDERHLDELVGCEDHPQLHQHSVSSLVQVMSKRTRYRTGGNIDISTVTWALNKCAKPNK